MTEVAKPKAPTADMPRPITTAPEGDIDLLLFDKEWHVGWRHMDGGWVTYGSKGAVEIRPTHWLPMPGEPGK